MAKNDDQHPKIVLDDRELKSGAAKRLFELGAVLEAKRLEVADYACSERVGVERKTAADFEASIVDGRLFVQAKELNRNFPSPLICIVGSGFERLNPKAVEGAKISLAVDYKIPLFFFDSEEEFADFLYAVAFREQFVERKEMRLNLEKRTFELAEQQQFIVESLPLIGPVQAKRLLEHFGSVGKVFSASEEELQEVEGIGEMRAKKIREVVDATFEKKKKK